MTILAVGAIVVILVVAAFALQNTTLVTAQFLAWQWNVDVGRLVVAGAALGALAVLLVLGADDLRLRWRLRQVQHRIARLETELAGLEAERDQLLRQDGETGPQAEGAGEEAAASSATSSG